MKKHQRSFVALALALTLTISLAGCGEPAKPAKPEYDPEKLALNTISLAELTDREKLLMESPRGGEFVFDFNADESYGELAMWVERYDFGVLAEERTLNMSSTLRSDEDGTKPVRGTIVFSLVSGAAQSGKPDVSTMRVTVARGSGSSAITIPPIETPADAAMLSGSSLKRETSIDGVIELAQISYSKAKGGQMEFAVSSGKNEEAMKQDDVTYLIKCEFVKKA